jgi:septal ring-binding cell division protein DamX
MQLPDGNRMHNHQKGTLLMLDASLRDHPSLAPPRPDALPAASPDAPKGDKDGRKKGHKKHAQTKHRAEVRQELSRISEALRQLRGRVSDLHALHLDREGRGAGLATRLDALAAEQTRARQLTSALDERVDALRARVDALRAEAAVITDTLADLAVQPDRDTALFALEDRIQEAEENLAGLRTQAGQGTAAVGLTEGLEGLGQDLAALAERLAGLEGRVARETEGTPAMVRLEQSLGTLGTSMDERIGALEGDIATLRDQNKRWREAERAWAEQRLGGLSRGLAGGIVLLALLLLVGFVATWWHGERQLDLVATRLAAVERGNWERLAALTAPAGQGDDRLGLILGQLDATMQGIQRSHAELGARLAALVAPVPDPAAGEPQMADLISVPATTQTPAEAPPQDWAREGRTVHDQVELEGAGQSARLPAVALPAASKGLVAEAPAPSAARPETPADLPPSVGRIQTEVPAVALGPTRLEAPAALVPAAERYALQLIGFRNPASIAPFARKHGILAQTRWLRADGRGRDWYLVFLGDYATRQEAEAAREILPVGLRSLSPVVRPLAASAQPLEPE